MIKIRGLSFGYAGGERALDGIDLDIKSGEFLLLTGPSGSGKTTLARCLNGLIPGFHGGRLEGSVEVGGRDALGTPPGEMVRTVGMLFQNPEDMFVAETVESEIGFTPSTLGCARVSRRVRKTMRELGIGRLVGRNLRELSGGEKQLVALASVLAAGPRVLVLDEPLSELYHGAAERLMDLLGKLNEGGMTIIIIEQRTERVWEHAAREVVLESGRIACDGPPKRNGEPPECGATEPGDALVRLDGVGFSCGGNKVFSGLSGDFREGELVVLEGPNGSGKTTLLKLVMGLLRADEGKVNVGGLENPSVEQTAGAVGYVFQSPDSHLFAESVEEEVGFILKNTGRRGDADATLEEFGILRYKDSYPRHLSGGEKQRVALASILVARPRVLLLDEPTRGMDRALKKRLAEYLSHHIQEGNLVIMATHDGYMAKCATRRVRL